MGIFFISSGSCLLQLLPIPLQLGQLRKLFGREEETTTVNVLGLISFGWKNGEVEFWWVFAGCWIFEFSLDDLGKKTDDCWMIQWIGLVGKIYTGNHGFSLFSYGVFRFQFSRENQSIEWLLGASHGSYDLPYFGYQGLDPKLHWTYVCWRFQWF